MKKLFFLLFTLYTPAIAGMEKTPFNTLSIDSIKQGTTSHGVANLQLILKLQVGEKVQFTISNGETVLCLVKEVTLLETEKQIRIFGDIINKTSGGFGFVFTAKGDIAGAIVFHEDQRVYALRPSAEANGFMFFREVNKENIQ